MRDFFFFASTIARRFPGSGVPQGLSFFVSYSCMYVHTGTHTCTHTCLSKKQPAWKHETLREERDSSEEIILLDKDFCHLAFESHFPLASLLTCTKL